MDKLIKINEANITILAQEKIYGQVLEAAPVDSFEDENFPDFEKGKQIVPLPVDLNPDPNSEVQPTLGKTVLRHIGCKGTKR